MVSVSIIVKKDNNISKYIVMIRKISGMPIIDIKRSIENASPAIKCTLFSNDDYTEKVENFLIEVVKLGGNLIILKEESNQKEYISVTYLLYSINRYREISKHIQELDFLTYGED